MINILTDKSGRTSKENIFLGNQHENLDETLHFLFPKEYKDYYKYITCSYSNSNQRVTCISPLVDDNFIVSSKIIKISGIWELNLICKTSPADLNDKVIDLTENNSSKEHIFISSTINACVSGNSIDVESFNNAAADENIANLYDSILALKNRVEEMTKIHEQNEVIRKADELERQEAENARKADESERVSAEQLRIEAEAERKADEVKRQSNESAGVETEKLRVNAENERTNAETERKQAEAAGGTEENKRAEAETARQSVETDRVNAENERVSAETSRKQFENVRQENEESRKQAETGRVETENLRVSAESAREQAEQARINAESQRVTAEAARESAERARVEAENAREQAEQLRVSAENLRVEAENGRDSVITKLREDLDANTKADGRTQRSLTVLWDLNKGISYRFENDNEKAYTKTVLSGAKIGAVNKIGGKTIVYSQLIDPSKRRNIDFDEETKHFKYSAWNDTSGSKYITEGLNAIGGHKYYIFATDKVRYSILYLYGDSFSTAFTKSNDAETEVKKIVTAANSGSNNLYFNRYQASPENVSHFDGCINMIDLTRLFGSGNEPSAVEEFESIFSNAYYPYSEGELMSMSVNEVEEIGKNIFKCENFSCPGINGINNLTLNNSYGTSINSIEPSNSVTVTQSKAADEDAATSYFNGYFCISFKPLTMNGKYVFSFDITPSNKLISSPKISVFF